MLAKDASDKDILDYSFGGVTVRESGSMAFISWIANKLNGVSTYTAATQELLSLVRVPPLGRMPEGEKIKIVRKMLSLDIELL